MRKTINITNFKYIYPTRTSWITRKNKILKIKEVDFMFKIAKLEKVNNEKVIINLAT